MTNQKEQNFVYGDFFAVRNEHSWTITVQHPSSKIIGMRAYNAQGTEECIKSAIDAKMKLMASR